jgi:hypothetical protein
MPLCEKGQAGKAASTAVGREAICISSFPLLLRLAFVFPGIVVETQGFVDCVCSVGKACFLQIIVLESYTLISYMSSRDRV